MACEITVALVVVPIFQSRAGMLEVSLCHHIVGSATAVSASCAAAAAWGLPPTQNLGHFPESLFCGFVYCILFMCLEASGPCYSLPVSLSVCISHF